MKLLYCIPSLDSAGGTERVLTNKVNYLVEKGFKIFIVLTEHQYSAPFFKLNPAIQIINLDINFKSGKSKNLFIKILDYLYKQYVYKKKLREILYSIKPDIVTSLLSYEIDFLHKIQDGSIKIAECHFNRNFRLQFVQNSTNNFIRILIAKWRNNNLQNKVGHLNCLITLTEEDKHAWSGIKCIKEVIPNALSFKSEKKSDCMQKKIVVVGRYTREKGYDILLSIWGDIERQYPDWHLFIYGDGIERKHLEQMVLHLHLNNVHLEHSVDMVNEVFLSGGFSVVPSRFEGFGMVIIEAMECGLPVIAFDCHSGPKEIITSKIDGILVPVEDSISLLNSIIYLIQNQAERIRMGKMAALKAEQYSVEKIMIKWIRLYHFLVEEE